MLELRLLRFSDNATLSAHEKRANNQNDRLPLRSFDQIQGNSSCVILTAQSRCESNRGFVRRQGLIRDHVTMFKSVRDRGAYHAFTVSAAAICRMCQHTYAGD